MSSHSIRCRNGWNRGTELQKKYTSIHRKPNFKYVFYSIFYILRKIRTAKQEGITSKSTCTTPTLQANSNWISNFNVNSIRIAYVYTSTINTHTHKMMATTKNVTFQREKCFIYYLRMIKASVTSASLAHHIVWQLWMTVCSNLKHSYTHLMCCWWLDGVCRVQNVSNTLAGGGGSFSSASTPFPRTHRECFSHI